MAGSQQEGQLLRSSYRRRGGVVGQPQLEVAHTNTGCQRPLRRCVRRGLDHEIMIEIACHTLWPLPDMQLL